MHISKTIIAAALAASVVALPAHALEVTAGDYEAAPGGTNIALLYYQWAERKQNYAHGQQISGNAGLESNIALARYIHVIKLSENAVIDPQFILPMGRLSTSGDLGALGSTSGMGDLIVGAPVKFILDQYTRDVFAIGPYLYLPTGSYDSQRVINLGENRWKALLQLAYIRHFNDRWALDVVGDVTVYGDNDDYTASHARRKQASSYEMQAHLRYNLSATTALSAGLGNVRGGETELNGSKQADRLNTTYARLTATSFVTPTVQLQMQIGRDLSVENGLKERARINFRLAKLF